MLSVNIVHQLKSLGIEASHSKDFVTGLRLMQLVTQVFYNGENRELSSKIRLGDQQKTGNNVLNINIILNHLKKDSSITLDEKIRELTAFKIIQQQDEMKKLVEWILSSYPIQKKSHITVKEEMSPPRQQQNQFENLYFVSSLQKRQQNHEDSLQEDNPQQKVVRKGSFKVLKPKITTQSKTFRDQNIKTQYQNNQSSVQFNSAKEPLKQRVIILNNSMTENDDREDLNCRKTIPKMYQKPPLYKSKQKQQKSSQIKESKKQTPPSMTQRPTDRQKVLKHIQNINKQILQEQKSMIQIQNTELQHQPTKSRKTSRKIFKIDIPQIQDKKKRTIVQWLISINLLNINASKFLNNLQSICKDGVIFLQIVNYYRGRGKQMCYFKQPKKSAEIHSNYQKLFTALSQQPDFRSQLTHQYQYFIPQAQPNAFWNLLSCIHHSFNKRILTRQSSINRYENSINRKIQRETSKRKPINQEISYQEIKYNSASLKKQIKSGSSSIQHPRKQTPKPNSRQKSLESQKSSAKANAPYGLIQIQQPIEDIYNTERGYKQMYLCKFKNIQTPHKNKSFHNSSLSKSRIKASNGSSKKKEFKPVIPSISLQMQMKVLKFLQSFQIQEQVQQLFKDPYRNGVLLCNIVQKVTGVECFASRKPKSIDDCRNNYLLSIQTIKFHKKDFNTNYESFIEQLLKGQRSLLYGIIWQLIRNSQRQNNKLQANYQLFQNQSSKQSNQQISISWIRSVQRSYPAIGQYKIRNQPLLYAAITNTDFLFHYSWFITGKKAITPTYERPVNDIQKESNLKKVLGYLVQSKIIRSDYLWKTKLLVKRQQSLLKQLVSDLINHYNHLHNKQQIKTVNFVKYLKRQDSEIRQKPQQRLETTMANQTISHNNIHVEQPKIQIAWMRKLGFNGSLQLNNGVILCRLMAKINMKTIEGFNQHPQSRAQSLGNIRRAIKDIPKFRWDQYDILECDHLKTLQIYAFSKDRYKHAYAMKGI